MTIGRRFAVLAVCTANICRSPVMEVLLRTRLDPQRFEVASAGVRGWDRQPMDPMAADELRRLGHTSATFRSRPIDSSVVESADLILTATREHRSEVLVTDPKALRRTFTLLEFAALSELVDAGGPEVHRATAEQIDAGVATVALRLNALAPTP
ncbi:MAG: hypothetical protein ABWY58_06330 [Aeromicrobium sp.]